jgi:hypothetical protein
MTLRCMGMQGRDMGLQITVHPLVTSVGWIGDNHHLKAMDVMMMLLAKREFTTDLAGLWLSNLLAHCIVLPEHGLGIKI